MRHFLLSAAAFAALIPAAALANPISVVEGSFGSGNNLEFNSCTDPRPAAPNDGETGCLNARPGLYVYVYSNEALDYDAGGQAKIVDEAGDGYNTLTIDFADDLVTFTELTLNVVAVKKSGGGEIDFGNGFVFSFDDTGEAKFKLVFAPGVNSYTFSATEGIWAEVKQVRFRFGDGTDVPEPGALGLLGLGLVGLGLARRRRG